MGSGLISYHLAHMQIEPPMTPETPPDQDLRLSFSSTSSADSDPLSPSSPRGRKLLNSIPAVHIGSIRIGKLQSVTELVQKALAETQPSQVREVSVWLNLTQVQLVDMTYQWEFIYAMHETSCIKAIGVYPDDRRFFGYIIQEKHKPLMGEQYL